MLAFVYTLLSALSLSARFFWNQLKALSEECLYKNIFTFFTLLLSVTHAHFHYTHDISCRKISTHNRSLIVTVLCMSVGGSDKILEKSVF
jgi:hypothetical protein